MKTNCAILFLLLCFIQSKAQIISTYAGGGAPGDGGPANLSRLTQPYASAFDTLGNLYIADYYGHRIRKISPTGIITTLAGTGVQASTGDGGPAKSAQLAFPSSIATDKAGNVYVAEGHKIRKIGLDGMISTVAGNGNQGYNGDGIPATSATMYWPQGVAVDAIGNIYISDYNNYRLRKVDTNGIISTIAGTGIAGFSGDGGPATAARIYLQSCVTIDAAGNIFLGDGGNRRIRKINTSGIISTIAGTGAFGSSGDGGPAILATISYVSGVLTDNQGNIFISDRGNNKIRKINSAGIISTIAGVGTYGFSGDGGLALNAKFAYPEELSMDAAGNILVADSEDARVRKIDMSTGIINTIIGSDNYAFVGDSMRAIDAELKGPTGLSADYNGNIYVADFNNVRVRKITKDGLILTVAGGGTTGLGDGADARSAQLYSPTGITIDKAGNLYIADRDDNRVRKVSTNGIITTIAGTGVQGFSGDGGLAINAQLYKPYGVAIDSAGDIFISDQYNYRIRKITKDGIINTVAGTGAASFSGDGGDAKAATLYFPAGLAADSHGNIFIADQSNYRIRKLDRNNIITTIAGGGGDGVYDSASALLTDLYLPIGVTVDSADNVYIAEFTYPQIRKVSPGGIITSFAGNGWYGGFGGDGGNAKDALLKYVQDVVTDADGNVYVSDGDNNRVRKITQNTIATISGNASVCRNSASPVVTFTYTGSSSFAPYTFTYRINGGAEQSITTVSGNTVSLPVSTGTSGAFVYTLFRVADNKLYTSVQNGKTTITIGDPTPATITASGPVKNICPGKTVTLTASVGAFYSWNNGDTTPAIIVSAAGRYAVTVTNTYGCTSVSAPVNVTYTNCAAPTGLVSTATAATQAKLKWKAVSCATEYKVQYRKQGTFVWTTVVSTLPNVKLKKLSPSAVYEWQVATVCDSAKGFVSSFNAGTNFTMPSSFVKDNAVSELVVSSSLHVSVIPNPVQQDAILYISNAKGNTQIILSDVTGKTLWKLLGNNDSKVQIPVQQLTVGVYIVTIQDSKNKTSIKLIKE